MSQEGYEALESGEVAAQEPIVDGVLGKDTAAADDQPKDTDNNKRGADGDLDDRPRKLLRQAAQMDVTAGVDIVLPPSTEDEAAAAPAPVDDNRNCPPAEEDIEDGDADARPMAMPAAEEGKTVLFFIERGSLAVQIRDSRRLNHFESFLVMGLVNPAYEKHRVKIVMLLADLISGRAQADAHSWCTRYTETGLPSVHEKWLEPAFKDALRWEHIPSMQLVNERLDSLRYANVPVRVVMCIP